MWPVPAAPAYMVPDAIPWNSRQGVIGRVDADRAKLVELLQVYVGEHPVPVGGDPWIIQLDEEAGIDDHSVLLLESIRDGVKVGFFTRVVLVLVIRLDGNRRRHWHERFLHAYPIERSLEVSDIDLDEPRIILNGCRAHPPYGYRTMGQREAVV